ncbi:MAG: SCO family protein [Gammaproteobacteria bacterium]|nr:SCO family protein [Gammaproteobacteria bacterium]
MNKNINITVISCLVFVVIVLALTYNRITGGGPDRLSVEELRELGALVYEQPVALQPFRLQDHKGQEFSQADLVGRWTLIFFGFTSCPDICPLTLTELNQFYQALPADTYANDTRVVMVSVDPDRDNTQRLADYMSSFHPDFVGLNGPYSDVAALARQLFIAHTPPPSQAQAQAQGQDAHAGHVMAQVSDDYLIDHSGNILIINPQGQYYGFFAPAIQDRELTLAYEAIRAAY